jgi:hypothetical protein
MARMKMLPSAPRIGAAQVLVPKKVVGMMFWICGVPGRLSMVKVKAPSAIVPGHEALGDADLAEHLGRERVDGEDDHEQRDAAVGQHGADQDDRQHRPVAADQPDHGGDDRLREAESSMTLPNTAPSRNTGK